MLLLVWKGKTFGSRKHWNLDALFCLSLHLSFFKCQILQFIFGVDFIFEIENRGQTSTPLSQTLHTFSKIKLNHPC